MASADVPSPRPPRVFSLALRYGAVGLVAAVLALSIYKGLWVGIQGWGRPYWWLDYHHGFVRRGLAGEVFQAVFGRLSETQLVVPVGWEHRVCLLVLAATLLVQLEAALRAQLDARRALLIVAVAVWAAASQFWPTLAYNQGYLDSLVLALAAVAALLMRARLYWAVGLCLMVGPFVHEYFCFLVPFVLACEPIAEPEATTGSTELVGLDVEPPARPSARHILWLAGVALGAAAVVMLLPAAASARLEIAAMPISPEDRSILTRVTLTQSLQQSLSTCLELFFQNPGFALKNLIFFAGPGLLATGALLFWAGRRPGPGLWLRAAAALFPLAALALAWDLSRLLVMIDFTGAILFLITGQDMRFAARADRAGPSWPVVLGSTAAGIVALAYIVLPLAYVYYPPAPATLYPLTSRLGLSPRLFGAGAIWPVRQISVLSQSLPPDQKRPGPQLMHDLFPIEGVSRSDLMGWRIAPQPVERLVLYGPYIDLQQGRYRVAYRLRALERSAACAAPEARIGGTTTAERKPVTSQTRVQTEPPCAWTVSADLDVPAGGATAVETQLFLKAPEALLVQRYDLEPVAAQSR